MISQNILNLVDTAMVGSLGDSALAAVGIGSFTTFMFNALLLGSGTAVQSIVSRRKGEGKSSEMGATLNVALLIIAIVGPVLTIVYYFLTPFLFPILNADPSVVEQGVPYLTMRVFAVTFVGMNMSFRGFWNGSDRPKFYMMNLIFSHLINVVLNYAFIYGNLGAPEMGTEGAGLATTISMIICTLGHFILGAIFAHQDGFLRWRFQKGVVKSLVKLSIPSGLQQLMFAAGFSVLFKIVGLIGTAEVAAVNVLMNLMLVGFLPCMALGLAASTLVGQALGRKDVQDAKRWTWDVVWVGVILVTFISLPALIFPKIILGIFIYNPLTVDLATYPLMFMAATIGVEALGMIIMQALLGAGDVKSVMRTSVVLQWLVFLPLAYVVGPMLGYGLIAVWVLQGVYRSVQAIIFVFIWRKESWALIRV